MCRLLGLLIRKADLLSAHPKRVQGSIITIITMITIITVTIIIIIIMIASTTITNIISILSIVTSTLFPDVFGGGQGS